MSRMERYRLRLLILVTVLSGMSQGLLLPMLTLLQAKAGVASGLNGLTAAAMYLGTSAAMFFVEAPLRRYGYKPVIAAGLFIVGGAALLFPLWSPIWFWSLLRILIGVGDSSLHYCTQLWIIASSPPGQRGKRIAMYGMAYAIGFSIGPSGMHLARLSTWLPFYAIGALLGICFLLLLRMQNAFPGEEREEEETEKEKRREEAPALKKRYIQAIGIGWFALLPSLLYGYMESSMNSNFPLYGLKLGLSDAWIATLLPAIGLGSLVLQIPLGALSDRGNRKLVLMVAGFLGACAFLAVPSTVNPWVLLILLGLAGGLVGSFFSLGLAYLADLLPKRLLPAGNAIASLNFSIGSLMGPSAGGFGMQYLAPGSMFAFIGGGFLLFTLLGCIHRSKKPSPHSIHSMKEGM